MIKWLSGWLVGWYALVRLTGEVLSYSSVGKPSPAAFRAAEAALNAIAAERRAAESSAAERKDCGGVGLQRFYMVGDNPATDIRGANEVHSGTGGTT